jgi:cellulose synthase/poly-beta-1,6-N-acetylglucosamine synthase-like glycosyltransferase
MGWKKTLWFSLTVILFAFLGYYVVISSIHIVNVYKDDLSNWKAIVGLTLNFLILLVELFSSFYSVFIYYYIGSSSEYRLLKDDKNKYLTSDPLPKVAIFLPFYKEPLTVVSKTIDGALNIDYPKNRFEVVVCDDSPAGESTDIEAYCKEKNVKFIHRDSRKGFKAGAINNALSKVKCDFVGILDSDHIPTPNFIRTCLSGFTEDDIILVQGKPMFVNQDNYLQRSSAYIHTQFFHVYQKSRGTRNGVIFAGTTGMFRTDLLLEYGGFHDDTLAEDTDTSFALMSKGYRTRYLHIICSKGLVPWNPISMINQVWRWTNGITSIIRKRLWTILRGKNSVINKTDILSTLFTPVIGVTMWFVNLLLYIMFMLSTKLNIHEFEFTRPILNNTIPLLLAAPLLIALASFIMAYVSWYRESKEDRMIKLRGFFGMNWTISAFYMLMLTAQSFLIWAVLSALLGVKKDFDRTVKEKTRTMGKMSAKIKYTLWSIGLFGLAVLYYIASWDALIIENNAVFGWFIFAAISLTIPIIITITHFREIDRMQVFAATKTADDIEKEHEEKQT